MKKTATSSNSQEKTQEVVHQLKRREAELSLINNVQEGILRGEPLQEIYNLVGNRIRNLFDAQIVLVSTFNSTTNTEHFKYAFEDGAILSVEPRPIDKFRQRLIETKEMIILNENVDETWTKFSKEAPSIVPGIRLAKSALFVPMVTADAVQGYLSLQNVHRENAFSESDVRLVSVLANSISVAVENARLSEETTRLLAETEQSATELEAVNSISQALVSQLEFKAFIKLIGDHVRQTFQADNIYVALYDRTSNMLNFPYTYGDDIQSRPFGNAITEKIILKKQPLLVNQDLERTYKKIDAEKSGKFLESYLGVPIITGNQAIGVISIQSSSVQNKFTENDLRLLTTIGANVGVAMQNAEAYGKLQTAMNDLASAQKQLVQQEKLASLGRLTAGIAHEIKNPLNFVTNFSDLNVELIEEVFEELKKLNQEETVNEIIEILQDVNSNLKKIHSHGTRADGILKSMLQHSRGGSGKVEPTDLNNLIKEYVNLSFHGMRAGKKSINVSIDLELDEHVGMVPLIREDFSRVILNLCTNAFDAMRERLTNDSGKGEYTATLTVKTFVEKEQVHIHIEDNGIGIPEDYKDKILQPFFTTKKDTEGTGLGLSITYDIIKAHQGVLKIESQKGSYTRFIILIPSNR